MNLQVTSSKQAFLGILGLNPQSNSVRVFLSVSPEDLNLISIIRDFLRSISSCKSREKASIKETSPWEACKALVSSVARIPGRRSLLSDVSISVMDIGMVFLLVLG